MTTLISLLPAYRDYLELERALRPMTVKAYIDDLKRLHDFVGDKAVPNITLADLRGHVRNMAGQGLSTETIRRRIHSMNTFYKWLELEGIVTEQISRKLHLPKRVRKQPPVSFTLYKSDYSTSSNPLQMGVFWLHSVICFKKRRHHDQLYR
jgi:integrase/recombinase XerD